MSTYVQAVLKIADGSKFAGEREDAASRCQEMAHRCIKFGHTVFELDGHIFAIVSPRLDDDDSRPIQCLRLPFELKDFEV